MMFFFKILKFIRIQTNVLNQIIRIFIRFFKRQWERSHFSGTFPFRSLVYIYRCCPLKQNDTLFHLLLLSSYLCKLSS